MSGTSMDTLDAALVDFEGDPPALLATHAEPMPADLRHEISELCRPGSGDLHRLAQIDVRLGHAFANAAQAVLDKAPAAANEVLAIGSHGQTVRHHPQGPSPYTLQIGDPNIIAEVTGVTTVADFRRRDIAAGGQGAPLVPAFHAAMFRSAETDRVVLNIGGMANVSVLPRDAAQAITGFDTGPGNVLMDGWIGQHLGRPLDEGGAWAATGTVSDAMLSLMLADPYFTADPPKSTGREHFNLQWLEDHLQGLAQRPAPADVQATLCELTAASVALAIAAFAPATEEVLVCGGGTRNTRLLSRLRAWMGRCRILSTADYGLDPGWVEAMAFAWLAKQTLEGRPGNLPTVTGARRGVILGGIYPGRTRSSPHQT